MYFEISGRKLCTRDGLSNFKLILGKKKEEVTGFLDHTMQKPIGDILVGAQNRCFANESTQKMSKIGRKGINFVARRSGVAFEI